MRASGEGRGGVPSFFLGDYVDRGPDSRGVVKKLIRRFTSGLRGRIS